MPLPASRFAALVLAVVVLLMAGAPSVAAKRGSHGHQRKELRVEERSDKKDSPGHHRGQNKPRKGSNHGHHRKQAPGRQRHARTQHDRKDTGAGTSLQRGDTSASKLPRLRLETHDPIELPVPKPRQAAGPAIPLRPRPIRAWHPRTIRAAVVETGRALAFPMALSLLALGFVLGHGRMDARDPKLARAPVNHTEQLVAFE